MLIKPLFINAFEIALNQYISLDEDIELFLTPLAGKVIALIIQPFNQTIYLCPTTEKIQILESYNFEPDTTITGTLSALSQMGLSNTPMQSIFNGEVSITGDTHISHKFQQLFEKLDIDLEEKISQFTGDIVAHKIGTFFRHSQNWTEETLKTLKLNTKEFLQEETKDLPATPEAEVFFQQVDKLRADFDRLSARVEQLGIKS